MTAVVTTAVASDKIECQICRKIIALPEEDTEKDWRRLYREGFVPVPNFGWFCSQACAFAYEQRCDVKFQRIDGDRISYYPEWEPWIRRAYLRARRLLQRGN